MWQRENNSGFSNTKTAFPGSIALIASKTSFINFRSTVLLSFVILYYFMSNYLFMCLVKDWPFRLMNIVGSGAVLGIKMLISRTHVLPPRPF
jgi:hypothetical protein